MLKTNVDSCFQSVSNGKALLASTLTGLGVSTSSDATFETINTNIQTLATNMYNAGIKAGKESITVGGTVENKYILNNKTVTVNGVEKYKGTMPDNGATGTSNLAAGNSYTIPAGYTSGGTVSAASLESQTVATATEDDILYGETAWVGGELLTGKMDLGTALKNKLDGDLTILTSGSSYTCSENSIVVVYMKATPDKTGYKEAVTYNISVEGDDSQTVTAKKDYYTQTGNLVAQGIFSVPAGKAINYTRTENQYDDNHINYINFTYTTCVVIIPIA